MTVYIVYHNNIENEIAGVFADYDTAMNFIEDAPEGKYFSIPDDFEVRN